MSKFKSIKDGEPITLKYVQALKVQALKVKGVSLNFSCCDCKLVHNIVIIPLKTRLKMYLWRDNRRTANRRRKRK